MRAELMMLTGLGLTGLLLLDCSSSSSGRAAGCETDSERACTGEQDCDGQQTCDSDGQWGPCLCPGAGGTAGEGSGGTAGESGGIGGDAGNGGTGACGTRDCSSSGDHDCNGTPDDQEGPCTACSLATSHPCEEHTGLDGTGICQAGTQTCELSDDRTSVAWSDCVGSVGPDARDCTSSEDNDCDGTPDAEDPGCSCEPDAVDEACGPQTWPGAPAAQGICHPGTAICTEGGVWGTCTGFQLPEARDCTSSDDNDCNGEADNLEEECTVCSLTGAPGDCDTGAPGICAAGTQVCELSADRTTLSWGPCEQAQAAGGRNCSSSNDNNCNGVADNLETACTACDPIGSSRPCNEHAEDGVGTCTAGTQTCEESGDHTARLWSTCTGDVGPTTEACGPTAPDTNCNGVVGDGTGCLKTIHIYQWNDVGATPTGCAGGVEDYLAYHVVAAEAPPSADWVEIGSFRVFADGSLPGVVPVRNCEVDEYYGLWTSFVKVGADCEPMYYSGLVEPWREVDVVGYVSASDAQGYGQLRYTTSRGNFYGHGLDTIAFVPIGLNSCPTDCSCFNLSSYAVP